MKRQDLRNIRQELDLWTGEIRSHFELEGQSVDVITVCHQNQDQLAVQVRSPLVKTGRLTITLNFPYGSGDWENATDWKNANRHKSLLQTTGRGALIERILDTTRYSVSLGWSDKASLMQPEKHHFVVKPKGQGDSFSMSCQFSNHTVKQTRRPLRQPWLIVARVGSSSGNQVERLICQGVRIRVRLSWNGASCCRNI
ncbi:hypothetical protein [Spirosoma telluris]|uniref:hypothetical protein n=1 Tax=Spirosoma telluris TaxID=2183553 RepID=UPI0018DCEFFA